MPMTGAQRRWLQTSGRAVDWHPGGQFPVMTSIGRVAPLDHSRRSFADGARGPRRGAGLKQLGEPTRAQSRALWGEGKAPERGCERRINWMWLAKDTSAWRIRLLLAPWCMSQRTA